MKEEELSQEKQREEIEFELGRIPLRILSIFFDLLLLTGLLAFVKDIIPAYAVYTDFAIVTIYYIGFIGACGKTPGKMLLKLKIIKEDGEDITYWTATKRYFASIISQFIFLAGYLLMFWTEKKQTLHDKLAHTIVISEGSVIESEKDWGLNFLGKKGSNK